MLAAGKWENMLRERAFEQQSLASLCMQRSQLNNIGWHTSRLSMAHIQAPGAEEHSMERLVWYSGTGHVHMQATWHEDCALVKAARWHLFGSTPKMKRRRTVSSTLDLPALCSTRPFVQT